MRVTFSNTLLGTETLAAGRVLSGLSLNGTPILDVAQLFRGEFATVFGRGDGPESCTFTVRRFFASDAAALAFMATHRATLPVQAALALIDDDAGAAYVMADAVRAVQFPQRIGLCVVVEYTFTGSRFTSESVPGEPTESDTVKAYEIPLDADDESKAVAFDTAFASTPRFVRGEISLPDGGTGFHAYPRESTRTAAGVTFDFDLKVPGAGYKLLVFAAL